MKWLADISVLLFCIAVPCSVYVILGAAVDPNGGWGAFGFLAWPTGIAFVGAFATQALAIRYKKKMARPIQ